MKFEYEIKEGALFQIVLLKGNLIEKSQAYGLIEIIDDLILQKKNHFILDLIGLNYVNSGGINTLVSILTKSRNAGGDAIIANIPDKLNKLLIITKLNTVFTVATSVEDAIDIFSKQ